MRSPSKLVVAFSQSTCKSLLAKLTSIYFPKLVAISDKSGRNLFLSCLWVAVSKLVASFSRTVSDLVLTWLYLSSVWMRLFLTIGCDYFLKIGFYLFLKTGFNFCQYCLKSVADLLDFFFKTGCDSSPKTAWGLFHYNFAKIFSQSWLKFLSKLVATSSKIKTQLSSSRIGSNLF